MLIHSYDPASGELLGSSPAQMNPVRPSSPLVPAHATAIAPPPAGQGRVAVFRAGAWSLVADLRGRAYWTADGAEHVMATLGPLPAGAILEPRPSAAHRWTGSAWAIPPEWPERAAARAAVVRAIEDFEVRVTGARSWGERVSWRDQEPAARAVLAGEADAPGVSLLEAIRAVTGEELEELARRVVDNAELFRRLVGPLVGYRQAIFAAIDAAADLEQVEDVTRDGLAQIAAFAARATQGAQP